MDVDQINHTKLSHTIITPTFIWCFLMPSVHLFSLISNILCIIVFCSNIFIKKPIAIYFICLLISDSITLLIGYIEMIDRESNMIDKSSSLCIFNGKIIHTITDYIYTFMGRFCLEWMLYKVLWTRASTILLAILSVQRSRTFLSISYHETRSCAFYACIVSLIIALTITCLEWTGVHYDKINNLQIYYEIYQTIIKNNFSKDFYSTHVFRNYNESVNNYTCLINSLSDLTNQSNCSSNEVATEFYIATRSLLSNRDPQIGEITTNLLINPIQYDLNFSNQSLLHKTIEIAKTSEIIGRLFEKRSCHITLNYSLWLKLYNFLHSVSFSWNRRIVAIFFGNALPSFIVVLANLLSLKVIYFSKSLKYLKQSTRKNRRKRRLQNDLRAFLVILIESFSIILISWGIPILLTMYHCQTLYVVNISTCPKIKDYLALFLFTDLFNSSTNCLLYSLSGKLFRRKFIDIIKSILTCGRGTIWNIKQHSLLSTNQPFDRQLSNNPSINNNNNNCAKNLSSKPKNSRLSERLSSPILNNPNRTFNNSSRTTIASTYKRINGQNQNISDDGSFSMGKTSDDQHGRKTSSSENDSDFMKRSMEIQLKTNSRSIKSFFIHKVRTFSTANGTNETMMSNNQSSTIILSNNKKPIKSKKKFFHTFPFKQQHTTDLSFSSSSFNDSVGRTHSSVHREPSLKTKSNNDYTIDNLSITDTNIHENLTSL